MLFFIPFLVESEHIYNFTDAPSRQGQRHWLHEQQALVFLAIFAKAHNQCYSSSVEWA